MRTPTLTSTLLLLFVCFSFMGCNPDIERSGYVVDKETLEPIENVSIDIYMKHQKRDSLQQKVFTNYEGYFSISEKRGENQMFQLYKEGYIGFVNSLSVKMDTIKLEKE